MGFVKKYILALGIFILGALLVGSFFFSTSPSFEHKKNDRKSYQERKDIPKLSEIKGPRIDSGAASIVREEGEGENICAISSMGAKGCATLPVGTWVLLLATYLFLIIFNLGITFGKRNTVQWVWEAVYTVLALGSWFLWDGCRENLWFPLYVMALGVPIYLFYLYFFWEKQKQMYESIDEFRKNQRKLF